MKPFLIVCNFKANVLSETEYQKAMLNDTFENVVLCPNFCDIGWFSVLKNNNNVMLGAQNVSEFENGAYTGEITATMLKSAGADFCIVGHSERKKYNYETLSQINKKIKNLLDVGITPIVCVGEEKYLGEDKQTDYAKRYVLSELNELLDGIDLSKIVVAYEPVWAIGSGKVPSLEHIESLANTVKNITGVSLMLYGGSFNESNFEDIAKVKSIDGALVGGASLKPESIVKMQKKLKEIL